VNKKIQIAALRITPYTEKMFGIMNEVYQQKSGKPILFSELGKSIEHFNFFLTQSISQTLSISSLRNGSATSESLVNRLLQVSSQGKFSQIDTFVEKLAATKKAT
jgi:hypothetical protein